MGETTVKVSIPDKKSLVIALLLWFFLPLTGIHNFYLGRMKAGLGQLILLIVAIVLGIVLVGLLFYVIAAVWWLVDLYYIFKHCRSEENASDREIALNLGMEGKSDDLDSLERLHALYEKGVLTQDEYEAKRKDFI